MWLLSVPRALTIALSPGEGRGALDDTDPSVVPGRASGIRSVSSSISGVTACAIQECHEDLQQPNSKPLTKIIEINMNGQHLLSTYHMLWVQSSSFSVAGTHTKITAPTLQPRNITSLGGVLPGLCVRAEGNPIP